MFKGKSDKEEIARHGNGEHSQWGKFPTQSHPQEEVKQHNVQTVVEQVGTAKAKAVLGRGLFLESEVGGEPVVHQEAETIADGIGNVHIDPMLQDPVDDIVDGG